MSEKLKQAFLLAEEYHRDRRYGEHPYMKHIHDTKDVADMFLYLVPDNDRTDVLCSVILHDVIEDCDKENYKNVENIIRSVFGDNVANICLGVTDCEGATRKERHSQFYWERMRTTEYSVFVKLCDRIANIREGGKIKMYAKENEQFVRETYRDDYQVMFYYIDVLLKGIVL